MDTEQARDALTVIAETAGRWLPSEDFAIAVFGSNHALVKAFVEPYHTARARIGGVWSMGGTMPVRPLGVLTKMLASFRRSSYELILVIVSDFQIPGKDYGSTESEETKRLIREAEKLGIKTIGVGLCSGDLGEIVGYVKRATYVSHVRELPLLFFKLYRRAVTGMVA